MEKESIELPGASKYGPYSAGVRANGMIWLSGQIAVEAGDDVQAQTQGALDKIDALLATSQLSKLNLCFAQVLLADINDFAAMNEIYGAWVEGIEIRPARAAFAAASTSSAVPMLIVAKASSVAGFITSIVSRPAGSTHSPLI